MSTLPRIAVALALAAAAGASTAQATATASFVDPAGKSIGTARLTQTPNGMLIDLDLSGLPPGEHGFHVHEVGRCDGADGFKSAGGHFAPRQKKHGFHTAGGPHAGDLPSQFVAADGRLRGHVVASALTLGSGTTTVFDRDGSSLVIHAKADDYRSQPSGDSGDRIACAVIERATGVGGAAASNPR